MGGAGRNKEAVMEEHKINLVCFSPGDDRATVRGVWQWDFGQILRIDGLNLPEAVEIHFSLDESGGEAKRRIGVTKENVTDVRIPDFILEHERSTNYVAYAFIYVADRESGNTTKRIKMEITARPRPEAFVRPCEKNLFDDAIEATRESLSGSREAAELAEAWAHGREDHPEQAEDNAKYYADLAADLRKETADDKTEVEQMKQSVELTKMQVADNLSQTENLKNQAQNSAEQAALSEQAAKESENAANEARAGAESAEDSAEQYASDALARKNEVDQKVEEFETIREAAVKSVTDAGAAQKKAVELAGATQKQAVENAGTANVNAVNQAGTTKVNEINQAGESQKKDMEGYANTAKEKAEEASRYATNASNSADAASKSANSAAQTYSDIQGSLYKMTDTVTGVNCKLTIEDGIITVREV